MNEDHRDRNGSPWPWLGALAVGSLGWLIYGALFESWKLRVDRYNLRLKRWPQALDGYRIAVLGDFHVRDEYTVKLTRQAIAAAVAEDANLYVIPGDLVGYWKLSSPWLLGEALEGLRAVADRVIVIPGNHDYWNGDASLLRPILDELGLRLLRNEVWRQDSVAWVGIDSAKEGASDPYLALREVNPDEPHVVLWHEPDAVDWLPRGAALMISGHSHGGQWVFPWGWTPMHSDLGRKFVSGFYPDASTPLFVTRGIGTTGPPARLGALPEVAVLTLGSGASTIEFAPS